MRELQFSLWFAVASLLTPLALAAQETGGMLFSYQPHPGERESFDEGYREHLDWHRDKRDSLPWYGWDVLAGPRLGQFVDGTFGISFEALDRRVDPAGDAAHAARSFADHASETGRWAVRLRPDLSTLTPLENGSPAPLAQVVTYVLPVGHQVSFEEALRSVRERAEVAQLLPYSVYESVVGVRDAEFTVLVWRHGMAGFDWPNRDPTAAIAHALSGELGGAIRATSELWRLREDLTLVLVCCNSGSRMKSRVLDRQGWVASGARRPADSTPWVAGMEPIYHGVRRRDRRSSRTLRDPTTAVRHGAFHSRTTLTGH